ncbi:MAG: hypothetical protein U0271_03770 [Polyangiaceae bacterium]
MSELSSLVAKLHAFRAEQFGVDELQRVLWSAASSLRSAGERELGGRLQVAEGQVERLRFTVDRARVRDEALKVVAALLLTLS